MKRKTVLLLSVVVLLIVGIIWVLFFRQKTALLSPGLGQPAVSEITPSQTFKEYSDPVGFSFSYPDNLSITKAEIEDQNTYADIQLSAKGVDGSINIKIADTKLKSVLEWIKTNTTDSSQKPTEVKWGNLKAQQVETSDRLLLGALDQGVLFTIEIPLIKKDFWFEVYNKILADFSFAPPDQTVSAAGGADFSDSVSFEGEEVVE